MVKNWCKAFQHITKYQTVSYWRFKNGDVK